jgi:heterodisulfide reductase subunit C
MDSTPRRIFALIHAGMRERVLESNTPWKCVSCYLCTSRCPQDVPITDVMYTLKRMSAREGLVKDREAAALARTFTGLVNRYGRSFEFGLASRFYLTHKSAGDLLRMGPLGVAMFKRGRMSLRPTRIRQLSQLQAIIRKARRLGGAS